MAVLAEQREIQSEQAGMVLGFHYFLRIQNRLSGVRARTSMGTRRLSLRPHGRKSMAVIWFLIIGVVAGWLAGRFMKGKGFGLVGDLIIGVIGAMLGGLIFQSLGITAIGPFGHLIVATFGAIVFVALVRALKRV